MSEMSLYELCESHAHYSKVLLEAQERLRATTAHECDRYADAVLSVRRLTGQVDSFARQIADVALLASVHQ